LIYLDNAATTFPKPPSVKAGVMEWLEQGTGSPGRGHPHKAEQQLKQIRKDLALFFGLKEEWRLIFTYSTTDALNLAIKGFVKQGDHVLISAVEHNSVVRPLRHLEQEGIITLDIVACDEKGVINQSQLWEAFTPGTRLVVLNHGSNVTGAVQPIAEIGQGIRERGAYLLVDAAQTAGVLPVNMEEMKVDLLACAGHKGLYGLPGTGLLAIGPRITNLLSWRQGGTGYNSESEYQPPNWPEAFEAGTLNMPGIVSLGKGLEFIRQVGLEEIARKERRCLEMLWEGLAAIPGVTLYGPEPGEQPRVAVLSFNLKGWEPEDLAGLLQTNYQIQLRSGLHCAPLAHRTIGTYPEGTVRISPGYFTQDKEIRQFIDAVKQISMIQTDWLIV
jgi:cysteine desulfurase/selenocysteine lyase